MGAMSRFSPPYVPLLLFVIMVVAVQRTMKKPGPIVVDTLSASNWTETESMSVSLSEVHKSGALHHKVWVLPFDDFWRLLQPNVDKCGAKAFETHVHAGAGVASAASEIGERIRRSRKVAPLIPLGRPFLLERDRDREIVHAFAMLVQGSFGGWGKIMDVKEVLKSEGCERSIWMKRLVSYAYRRFKVKGIVPRGNPLGDVDVDAEICCGGEVDISENLQRCAVSCGEGGVYDVVSMFPRER